MGGAVEEICSALGDLPGFTGDSPVCTCTPSESGGGLKAECSKEVSALGHSFGEVGIRLIIEPCGTPYIAIQYEDGSTWKDVPDGRVEADGDPIKVPIPGISVPLIGGVEIAVTVTGSSSKLTVKADLVVCAGDCTTIFTLIDKGDINLGAHCPPALPVPMPVLIGGGVAALVVLVCVWRCRKRAKKAAALKAVKEVSFEMGTARAQVSDVTPKHLTMSDGI